MIKIERHRDKIFFRVQRDGKFHNICFSDLEENEMREAMKYKNLMWLKSLVIALASNPYALPIDEEDRSHVLTGNIETLKEAAIILGNEIYNGRKV